MGFKVQNISGTTISLDATQIRPGESGYYYVIGPAIDRLKAAGYVSVDYIDLDPDNLGGSSNGITDPSGNPAILPMSGSLANATAITVGLEGVSLPRTVWVNPGAGDTVSLRYRVDVTAPWVSLVSTTSYYEDQLTGPVHEIEVQRTLGSSLVSAWGVA